MQEAEEQDTCRICSAPAEPDQPLFHPCKCSGTIRYIHQDCLTTWLAHSRKKTCDVCKHPYSFTKVYAPNMPSHLPPFLLLRRLIQQFIFAILFVVRVIGVALIWLALLPWITVWTWRMYFSMGETTAWWISNRPRPNHNATVSFFQNYNTDPKTLAEYITTHPAWRSLSADIFSGQMIAATIVLTFVSVFLLREWISQNARPGLFEEEDFIPPEEPPPPAPEPAPPRLPLAQRLQGFPDNEAFVQRQQEAVRALDALKNPKRVDERVFIERMERPEHKRRMKAIRTLAAQRRAKANQPPRTPREGSVGLNEDVQTPGWLSQPTSPADTGVFPPVKLEPPNEDIPYAIQRRPTLPSSTIAMANANHSFTISPGRSPMTSPGLATYHPPEELPSASYFDAARELERADDARRDWTARWDDAPNERNQVVYVDEMENAQVVRPPTPAVAPAGWFTTTDDESDDEEEDEEEALVRPRLERQQAQVPDMFAMGPEEEDDEDHFFMDEDVDEVAEMAAARQRAANPVQGEQVQQGMEGNPGDPGPAAQQGANNGDFNAQANGFGPEDQGFDPNDDLDGNVEDDMEGALEAVGIRGPIFGVFQNAALMVFVLDTAIGLCIWIPFTVGKTTALLALDPKRFLQLLHLPIKAMRLVTDPIVDSIAYLITRFIVPPCLSFAKQGLGLAGLVLGNLSTTVVGEHATNTASTALNKFYTESVSYLDNTPLAFWHPRTAGIVQEKVPEPEFLFPDYARFLEPYFANLGAHLRISALSFKERWTALAEGNGRIEKIFAVSLGYLVFGVLLAMYLNILTVGNARTAGRAVRSVIRQQLLVVKVAGFIFIELVVFPLGCGFVLDLCTVWLFPEANIHSRVAFFASAPVTALFYHWIAGTLFMYSFAVLLSGCRSIMRPGAMWFVKDPEDRNAHPIRDILEKHTVTQLRKIAMSGLMYSVVVACVVGSVAIMLVVGNKSVLPFRWKSREPLSDIPFDLLFLHLVLPQSMHHFRPRRVVRHFAGRLWKVLAKHFRLSSYFFGGRHLDEEITPRGWFYNVVKSDGTLEGEFQGTFRRVPATDSLALPREMRATAAVHADGTPLDDEAAVLIAEQDREAIKGKHDPTKDYAVVYIPPYFRYRLFAFIASMWSICATLIGIVFALPILIGRSFFAAFVPRPVHDGYSLIAGFYLLWACYLVAKAVDRLDKRRQRVRMDDAPEKVGDLRWLVFKRSLLWLAKSVYMGVMLGVVVPILLSLVVDLYLVVPLRTLWGATRWVGAAAAAGDRGVYKVRVVDLWVLGLMYGKIALYATQLQPPRRVARGLHQIIANGWVRLNPVAATKEVILPLVVGLLGMVLLPGLFAKALMILMPSIFKASPMEFYPTIFFAGGLVHLSFILYDMLSSWSQSVRDKEFLVELRLRNHEPEKENVGGNDVPQTLRAGDGEVFEEEVEDEEAPQPGQPIPEEWWEEHHFRRREDGEEEEEMAMPGGAFGEE